MWLVQIFTGPTIITLVFIFLLHISSLMGYSIIFGILTILTIYNLFSVWKMKKVFYTQNAIIIKSYFTEGCREIPIKNIVEIIAPISAIRRRIYRFRYTDSDNIDKVISFLCSETSKINEVKVLLRKINQS